MEVQRFTVVQEEGVEMTLQTTISDLMMAIIIITQPSIIQEALSLIAHVATVGSVHLMVRTHVLCKNLGLTCPLLQMLQQRHHRMVQQHQRHLMQEVQLLRLPC